MTPPMWVMRLLFGGLFTLLLLAVSYYLHRRLIRDALLPRRVQRIISLTLFAMTVLCVIALFAQGRDGQSAPWALVPRLWVGLILNLLLPVIPLELWRLWQARRKDEGEPISPARRVFLARAAAVGSSAAAVALTGFGAFRAYEPAHITEVPVPLPGLPRPLDGLVIAHLSDLHIGSLLRQRFLDDLVARTNAQKPDLVAITGDLVDGTPAMLGDVVARLANLQSRYGTYFVTGNHDYYSGAAAWVRALRGLGIKVLRNRRVEIGDGGGSFDLAGVDDWGRAGVGGDYDLEMALEGRDPRRAAVLLAHQPSNFDEVARRGVGLQLSGHTHGGQMFPATLFADAIWGERNAGLSRFLDAHIFVSRGCGFVGPAQRLGSPPEIGKVILRAT